MKAICLQTYIPLRSQPSESSEMVSQLLFGETYTIIESGSKWVFVRNHFDGYEGWCDVKMIFKISEQKFETLSKQNHIIVNEPWVCVHRKDKFGIQHILAGSVLRDLNAENFSLLDFEYTLLPQFPYKANNSGNIISDMALRLLNVPYLWGGRSAFGIDCSGLVQTCCRVAGINMLRDASQQATQGKQINSLIDAKPGDLAFFDNEDGKIVHTGILLSPSEIIHASGYVKIDAIDEKGIYSKELKTYTHKINLISRVAS
jgi:hypothetical protein